MQKVASDFEVPLIQIHSENTGLLWKTVLKNRVQLKFMPLEAVKKKHEKAVKEIPQWVQPVDPYNYLYNMPLDDGKKKKKCVIQ